MGKTADSAQTSRPIRSASVPDEPPFMAHWEFNLMKIQRNNQSL